MKDMQPKLEITNLIKPILNSLKIASDEIKALLEIGIPEYLQNQTEKYYFTNTFLHRAEKVRFDKVYFPISVGYNYLVTKFDKLEDVFDEYKCITIIGSAGSGKSTLIKYIFLNSIRQSYKIPILIELRQLNDYQGELVDFIYEKILNTGLKPSLETLKRAMKKGVFLFLFDGYDEIFTKNKRKIETQIENLVDKYPDNKYLISTRPGGGIEGIARFHSFNVKELSDIEIIEFIDLLVDDKERKNQIKKIIAVTGTTDYKDYLKNPLLLSMFILAFENHPEIPNRKSAFYKNVFDTLYSKHDGITKGSFPREKMTNLKREDFEEILSVFSFITIIDGKYTFTEEYLSEKLLLVMQKKKKFSFEIEDLIFDFRTSISIMIKEGFEYKFPHRSMQEYFTALFLTRLPANMKEKAYEKINNKFSRLSEDRSFNFWSLCKELDYSNYIKHFVLKELNGILEKLKDKKGLELLDSFNNLWEPTIFLENTKTNRIFIVRRANLFAALIDYENVYNYEDFCYFANKKKVKNELIGYVTSKDKNKNMKKLLSLGNKFAQDKVVKTILINNGICDVISNYIKNIELKIETLNKILSEEEEDFEDIIGT